VESELLWPFHDDVLACRIPPDHVVVFRAFE
jgi:hypothetical protein